MKLFPLFAAVLSMISLSACGDGGKRPENNRPGQTDPEILIAYFSCTGNTEKVADLIAEVTGGTLYELVPAAPYTSEDLDYGTDCRANREQNDPACRPAIAGSVENMEKYSVVYLGYPIWWAQAPKIVYTFLESYDFSGKTIVPFCTSGSSPIGNSAVNLHGSAKTATWLDGRRFSSDAVRSDAEAWIAGLEGGIKPSFHPRDSSVAPLPQNDAG